MQMLGALAAYISAFDWVIWPGIQTSNLLAPNRLLYLLGYQPNWLLTKAMSLVGTIQWSRGIRRDMSLPSRPKSTPMWCRGWFGKGPIYGRACSVQSARAWAWVEAGIMWTQCRWKPDHVKSAFMVYVDEMKMCVNLRLIAIIYGH